MAPPYPPSPLDRKGQAQPEWAYFRSLLGGVFLCTKYALKYMRARRTSDILNIWGGYRREPLQNPDSIGRSAYVVTKHAVRAFTPVSRPKRSARPACALC